MNMAIDPATAKLLAQAAVKVVTDRETRSKLLFILIGALAGFVVIIMLPIYLLTRPLEMLKGLFQDTPQEAAYVEQFKSENDSAVLSIEHDLILRVDIRFLS